MTRRVGKGGPYVRLVHSVRSGVPTLYRTYSVGTAGLAPCATEVHGPPLPTLQTAGKLIE